MPLFSEMLKRVDELGLALTLMTDSSAQVAELQKKFSSGATTDLLVGGGLNVLPVWTTATGSGAPVRATSPILVTPNIGTPSAGVVTNLTGTASININGTVGATTKNTGAFTTVSALVAGMSNTASLGQSSSNTTYGALSFSGNTTLTSGLGFIAGGAGDDTVYAVAPSGGQHKQLVNGSTVTTATSAGFVVTGALSASTTAKTGGYTVATLPAGTVGMRAYVTDALAPAYNAALVGGGAVTAPVFYNGAAWVSA